MPSRDQILAHLRAHGEATVEELARVTGLSPVTVRHHAGVLRDRGLVDARSMPMGRGRPRHVYRLASAGAAALDDGSAVTALADDALAALKAGDPASLRGFFQRLATEALTDRLPGHDAPVEARLGAALEVLADRGFAMRCEIVDEAIIVRAVGCPYGDLTERHEEICAYDLAILERAVGAEVSRLSWRRAGNPSCAFRVALGSADEA